MTRITKFLLAVLILAIVLSACVINPVVPAAVFDVTATARAQVIPPLPTIVEPATPPTVAATEEATVVPTVALPTVTPTPEVVITVDCLIKVNRSADGTLIYHLPGQPTYSRTKIDPAKGEFYTCDEQSAIDVGARKALR